nr:mechanosensitive ion channel protein B074543 [Torenia fournieri]
MIRLIPASYSSCSLYYGFRGRISFSGADPLTSRRLFSLDSDAKGNNAPRGENVVAYYSENGADASNNIIGGDEWLAKLKEFWQSATEAAKYSTEKVKQSSNEITPHVHHFLETHLYLRNVIVPIGSTLAGTLLAWSLLPIFFRRFHKYSIEGPGTLLRGSSLWGPVPYENSFWGALEDPVRYFITRSIDLIVLYSCEMVAPNAFPSQYVGQAWRGGVVVALVWFLHQWKMNVMTRALYSKGVDGVSRDKLLALDKISSVGLFAVGALALSEACGVAVQSFLTVGGIGGVATAFASKDILENVLSGLSVQVSQPFSVGDTIKAGCVEGQVVEIGLTTTQLLDEENFPVTVIVNKSRAKWRSVVRKIPIRSDAIDKVEEISDNIRWMLRSNPQVLGIEHPYCFLSEIEGSCAQLTLGCAVQNTENDVEKDILLEAVRIVKKHGAML